MANIAYPLGLAVTLLAGCAGDPAAEAADELLEPELAAQQVDDREDSPPDMSLPDEDWANHARFAEDNARLRSQRAGADGPRVVFMGNSITEMWPAADSAFWVRHPNYVNRGISGQTTEQMLVRFRPDVLALDPAAVLIHAGVNDFAYNSGPTTPDETFGNIVSMAQLARANGVAVALASIPHATRFGWRPGAGNRAGEIAALNARLRAYAEAEGMPYVDYHAPMAGPDGALAEEYAADSVHPTEAGYRLMGPLAEAGIAEALAAR